MHLTPASNIWQNSHYHQNQHDGGNNVSNTGSVNWCKKKKTCNSGMPMGTWLKLKQLLENDMVPVFELPKKRMEETGGNGSE